MYPYLITDKTPSGMTEILVTNQGQIGIDFFTGLVQ